MASDDSLDLFYEPAKPCEYTFTERKSRFIARIQPLARHSHLTSQLMSRRDSHPDAGHVVYAFRCGHPRPECEGCSDDGEPHGTAGKPVLDALGYGNITNALLTVVRYFGGVKLGTGGLVRAYGHAARGCLDAAVLRACILRANAELTVPYETYEPLLRLFRETDTEVVSQSFLEHVEIQISFEERKRALLCKRLQELSGGRIVLSDSSSQ